MMCCEGSEIGDYCPNLKRNLHEYLSATGSDFSISYVDTNESDTPQLLLQFNASAPMISLPSYLNSLEPLRYRVSQEPIRYSLWFDGWSHLLTREEIVFSVYECPDGEGGGLEHRYQRN